jgi:excisionase family DNA binding protein
MVDTLAHDTIAAQLRRVQEHIEELESVGRKDDAEAIKLVKDLAERAIAEGRQDSRRDLLTTGQAALALGISDQTIRNWVAAGRLPAVKRGVRTMIPRQAVVDEIERSRLRPDALPVCSREEEAAVVAARKAALAALPRDIGARLEALHDKLEDGAILSAAEKSEMIHLEQETAAASARLLRGRTCSQRPDTT